MGGGDEWTQAEMQQKIKNKEYKVLCVPKVCIHYAYLLGTRNLFRQGQHNL